MAVREKRRGTSQQDIDQMEVRKALTAAEYSRRQFVLNFAASKDIQLLIPGKKAQAIKEAEEWTVIWLAQNQLTTVSNDFFKYTVDLRLWCKLVGDEIPFPFAFMKCPNNPSDGENRSRAPTPKGDAFLTRHAVETTPDPISAPNLPASKQVKRQSLQRSESDNETVTRRHTDMKNAKTTEIPLNKARSLSLDSADDDLKIWTINFQFIDIPHPIHRYPTACYQNDRRTEKRIRLIGAGKHTEKGKMEAADSPTTLYKYRQTIPGLKKIE